MTSRLRPRPHETTCPCCKESLGRPQPAARCFLCPQPRLSGQSYCASDLDIDAGERRS